MSIPHPPVVTTICAICHRPLREANYELLSSLKVWHLYDDHRPIWEQIFGPVYPREPDPRTKRGRARIMHRLNMKMTGGQSPNGDLS
jgi:hypothetical protein